jgi:hypothetical protein
MKANELMVGDWIADKDGDKVRVENIISSEFDCYYGIDVVRMNREGRCDKWTVDFEDAQPLPLTAEILENNYEEVCRHLGHAYEWTWRGENGYVELSESVSDQICNDGYFLSVNNGNYYTMRIRYVHELQHLLRLAGVNNEITL